MNRRDGRTIGAHFEEWLEVQIRLCGYPPRVFSCVDAYRGKDLLARQFHYREFIVQSGPLRCERCSRYFNLEDRMLKEEDTAMCSVCSFETS